MNTKGKRRQASLRWTQRDVTDLVLEACGADLGFDPADKHALSHYPLPDPSQSTESFRDQYWRAEMWSKFPFDIGIDRTAVAIQSFHEFESQCAESNRRLCELWSRPVEAKYLGWLKHARELMKLLFEGFSPDEIIRHCNWGPGATTSMPRARATLPNKWVKSAHITAPALPYLLSFSRWCGREFSPVTIVGGNKVVTVPKNAKTERTIAIEPDWNMFFQLGLGGAIRHRLQRTFGLLWPTAQERNKRLAREGSLTNELATVDLKGASDTVSLALVELLLPSDVLQHVLSLRSPTGLLKDGTLVTYEKVSSMGNGFTFELETAIFYCLVRACSGYAVAYGDDIVCRSRSAAEVVDFLRFCGFSVNEKKTHVTGPFRESCGGHFHSGVDVTPPYVRRPLVGPARLTLCNRISELSDNGRWKMGLLWNTWNTCQKGIPSHLYGPVGTEGTLHVPFAVARPRFSRRYQCFTGTRLIEGRRLVESDQFGALLQSLWADARESKWRYTGFEVKNTRPVLRHGSWFSGWLDGSPWCVPE
jgi:hypothetical protein